MTNTDTVDTYALPVADSYLLYAPRQKLTALMNRQALALLKEWICDGGDRYALPETLNEILDELHQPVKHAPAECSGRLRPMFLGILPTRACNSSCAYCGFGASRAPQRQMDFHMATAAVDWMAEYVSSIGQNSLPIHFFGGEPFSAADLVDVVIHRARAVAGQKGLIPHFEVSTNGIFDTIRARFVGEYFDAVVLSFDGFQKIHDRHRGSFEQVKQTAEILSHSPAELCFRTCVSQESVSQLAQIVQWFCEEFRPSVINIETLQPTPESEAAGLNPPNPYEFAVHYMHAAQIAYSYGVDAVYAAAETETLRSSFCPLGKDTVIVSPEGRISSCYLPQQTWRQRGLDLDIGQLLQDGTMQIDFEGIRRVRRLVMEKPRCRQCFCRWTCAGGCHVNQTYPGCALEYTDFCLQTRIITAGSLLKKLGFGDVSERLLQDQHAMNALALQPSDNVTDLTL